MSKKSATKSLFKAKATKPVKFKPVIMRLGGWKELTYKAVREYRGIKWYLTSFGERNDRDDWVADLPGITMSVSKYHNRKKWEIIFDEKGGSWEEAANNAIRREIESITFDIDLAINHLSALQMSKRILTIGGFTHLSNIFRRRNQD